MAQVGSLENIRIWIFLGVIMAFVIGPLGDITSPLLMIVLISQMSLAMDGLSFGRKDVSENSKGMLLSLVCCFAIGTGTALLMGLFFIGSNPDIWKGWVMLAAVPCAVSVITAALYMGGDMKLSVLSLTAVYLVALIITPLISSVFAGDAVSPLEILKYIVLFVAVPLLMTFPLKKLHLGKRFKVVSINFLMFIMVILSVGHNRDFFFAEPVTVIYLAIACAFRTFAVGSIMIYLLRRRGCDRGRAFVYMPMAVWKNSGLASALCIVLLAGTPAAVLPCVISLLVETVWFAVMNGRFDRKWPRPGTETS